MADAERELEEILPNWRAIYGTFENAIAALHYERQARYVAADDDELPTPLVTKSGRVLTEAILDAMVEEAERGYDVDQLRRRER